MRANSLAESCPDGESGLKIKVLIFTRWIPMPYPHIPCPKAFLSYTLGPIQTLARTIN